MQWVQIREWLLPGGLARDDGFHQEVLSASFRGIRVIAGVETVVALVAFAGYLPRGAALGILLLAAATFGTANLGAAYPHTRLLAVISACAASVIAVRAMHAGAAMDYALGSVTCVMLAAVAAVPLLPVQSLCMGAVAMAAGFDSGHEFFFVMLALAATAVSATLMTQRSRYYRLYVDTLRTSA